jgi:hypothetical protein
MELVTERTDVPVELLNSAGAMGYPTCITPGSSEFLTEVLHDFSEYHHTNDGTVRDETTTIFFSFRRQSSYPSTP